ncbi:MAG: hypothetical protein KA341_13105, partial [Saprospiraceae bacterium]|nr:hypothetical protein [Saprospiraceae bacterium]
SSCTQLSFTKTEDSVKLSLISTSFRIERIRGGGGAEITSQSLIIQRRGSKDAALSSAKKAYLLHPIYFSTFVFKYLRKDGIAVTYIIR